LKKTLLGKNLDRSLQNAMVFVVIFYFLVNLEPPEKKSRPVYYE